MNPRDLLRIARQLARGTNRGRPREANLRRAVSATYYALFHALATCCADMLAGTTRANRSQQAWRQAYRALEHGYAKSQCLNQSVMTRFPAEIRKFGEVFVDMQRQRHRADYDPGATFTRSGVLLRIEETEKTIKQFERTTPNDRRAFAIYVLLRLRTK